MVFKKKLELKKSQKRPLSDEDLMNVTGGADPYDAFCNSFKDEVTCNSHRQDGNCSWEDFGKAGWVCIKMD